MPQPLKEAEAEAALEAVAPPVELRLPVAQAEALALLERHWVGVGERDCEGLGVALKVAG